jgi:itaconyl-CoA hydratase
VPDVSENGIALGWSEIRLPHPVYPGDTLYSETEVVDVRESKSRPQQGIVTVKTRGYNQHGDLVVEMERAILVWKRAHAPAIDLFPAPRP